MELNKPGRDFTIKKTSIVSEGWDVRVYVCEYECVWK